MLRRLLLVTLLALVTALTGCAKGGRTPAGSQASDFKVALLSPGPVNDKGWNQLGYNGLMAVKRELGVKVSQKQTTASEFEADFREFANSGYQVIIGHGFELQPAAITVSKDFPNTVFVISAGDKAQGNVVPVIPKLEEATYLMGVLAARMSRTHKAGLVGGMEIPPIKSTFAAFERGAESVHAGLDIKTSFVGSWDDTGSAKEATLALISQGCDFIFQNADAAGLGVIQACQQSKGVWALGSNSNQNDVAPQTVLASAVLEIPKQFVEICRSVQNGTFKPREFRLTLANGHTSLVYNPRLKSRIPADVLKEIDTLKHRIEAGELKVERAHF